MSDHVEETVDSPEPVELLLTIGSGSVRIVADEVDVTTIRVTGDRAAEVRIEQDSPRIAVVGPRPRWGSGVAEHLDVTVQLPSLSRVAIRLGSADLATRGRLAAAQVRAGSGHVAVDELGDAHLVTGSGAIHVGSAHGDVLAKTGSGEITVDVLTGEGRFSTGSGDVHVGRLDARARVKTGSGDVSLGVPDEVAVWTDLRTGSGRLRSALAGRGAPAAGEDHLEVRVTTGSGDIVLTPA